MYILLLLLLVLLLMLLPAAVTYIRIGMYIHVYLQCIYVHTWA